MDLTTWKKWKNAGPTKVGVFEKKIWHQGDETDAATVRLLHTHSTLFL